MKIFEIREDTKKLTMINLDWVTAQWVYHKVFSDKTVDMTIHELIDYIRGIMSEKEREEYEITGNPYELVICKGVKL